MSGHVCGTGVWSGPLPGDPDTNAILTATPAFGGIDVTWTAAITNAHAVAHTYLYRSTSPDFATSVRIALVGGTHFYDKLESQLTYYYWIQVVSINGTVGQVIGPASAVPRLSIDATIEQLTGRIDSGVLAQSLKQDIDKIPLLNGDLLQEIQDRIAANELLGAAIQIAQTDASQAVSLINDEITQRTTAYNVLLQSLNTMAGQVNDNQAAIQNEATLRISNDQALAQQITNVQSSVGDDIAAVQTTLQTNIDTVDGKVTDIGALYTAKVKVNGLIGGFGVYNDGTEVQAGFDVDTFWVGRTGPDKKKPFIIQGGEVFIDNAVINQLTADKIDSRNLTIKDAAGNIIFGAGTNLDWSRIANKTGFASISKITSSNVTTYIDNAAFGNAQIGGDIWSTNFVAGSAGWRIYRSGSAEFRNITARGNIEATSLKANTLMVNRANIVNAAVDTLQIEGNAVTIPVHSRPADVSGIGGTFVNVASVWIDALGSMVSLFGSASVRGGSGETAAVTIRIVAPNGSVIGGGTGVSVNGAYTHLSCVTSSSLAGTYTLQVNKTPGNTTGYATNISLFALGTKR